MSILVLILFISICFCFRTFFIETFLFNFIPQIFYWSIIWLHDFFGFAFYKVIPTSGPGSRVGEVSPGWFKSFFTIYFFQSPLIFYLLGMKFYYFLLLSYGVILILCDGLHVNSSWLRVIFFVWFICCCCLFFNILLNLLNLLNDQTLDFLELFYGRKTLIWLQRSAYHQSWFY